MTITMKRFPKKSSAKPTLSDDELKQLLQLVEKSGLPKEQVEALIEKREQAVVNRNILPYDKWLEGIAQRTQEIIDHLQDTNTDFGKRLVTPRGEYYKRPTIASMVTQRQGATAWFIYQLYEVLGISPSWFLSGRYEDERYENFMRKYHTEVGLYEKRIKQLEEENRQLREKFRNGE